MDNGNKPNDFRTREDPSLATAGEPAVKKDPKAVLRGDLTKALDRLFQAAQALSDARAPILAELENATMLEQAEFDRCKALVETLGRALGESCNGESGMRIAYTPAGVTVSWDKKMLDGYAMDHQEILAAREEKSRAARLSYYYPRSWDGKGFLP